MDISVVIPVLNEEKRIASCITALINQNFPKDNYEILIVDNGSTDKSVEISKSFEKICQVNGGPDFKIIQEPKKGITFARQRGLLEAKGKYYVSTDADAIPPENWLSNAKKAIESAPDIVAATGPSYGHDGDFFTNWIVGIGSYLLANTPKRKAILGCNMALKKEAAMGVGGFVMGESKFHEDSIISARLKKVGRIVVDKNFKIDVSNRRYRGIRIFNIFNNIINYLSVRIIDRPLFNYFPEIR